MHTRAAAQFFFFFIRHKEGDGGFWKLGGKFFRQHLTRGLPATPYLFLPASSNLLCSAEWKWRMIGLVSVRPRKPLSLSKLPSPRACHLFIDDGYGGLTKNPPRLQLGEITLRGAFFLAGSGSPFPHTKPSWALWPGLWTWQPLVLQHTAGWVSPERRGIQVRADGYSRDALSHRGEREREESRIPSVVSYLFHLICILACLAVAQNPGQELEIWKLNIVLRGKWNPPPSRCLYNNIHAHDIGGKQLWLGVEMLVTFTMSQQQKKKTTQRWGLHWMRVN